MDAISEQINGSYDALFVCYFYTFIGQHIREPDNEPIKSKLANPGEDSTGEKDDNTRI